MTNKEGEVDFVVIDGMKAEQLVQVCWDVNDAKTREGEGEEGEVCATLVLLRK